MKLEYFNDFDHDHFLPITLYVTAPADEGVLYLSGKRDHIVAYVNPKSIAEAEKFILFYDLVRTSPLMKALK